MKFVDVEYQKIIYSTQFKAYLQTCSVDAPASLAGYKSYLNAAGVSTDALRLKTVLLTSAMSLGIGFAIQAVISGISKMIQAQEEARQSAQDAANAYVESASSIEEYAKKYEELHSALLKAKGNEEETYYIKKQLLDLQTELNDKYRDEYSKLNLVTEAYKDQTDAIKALNKENANKFLNENESAINKAENQMTKQHHYNLSYTGISKDADNNKDLLDIAKKYENKGIELLKDTEGLFSIHLSADATDAENVIQSFMTDIRAKAKELGNEHLFDNVLDISNSSLSDAQETIEKYGEIYNQALLSQIVTDPTGELQDGYNKALRAVEAYNEAVLRSENPYNDENVKKAYDNLQTVRAGIIENGEEWNKYASIMDDVWSSADTKVYDLNSAINSNQDGIGQFIDKLNGIEDIDLGAKIDSKDSDVYNDLSKYADKYNMTIEELVNSLVKLGYVQTNISDNIIEDSPINLSISETIDQLNTQLKPAFDSLKSAYQDIFTEKDGKIKFTLENVDLSTLDSIKSKLDDMSELGLSIDTSSYENLARVLSDSSSTATDVQSAFDSLSSSVLKVRTLLKTLMTTPYS